MISEGKGKRPSVETKGKRHRLKSQKASSDSSDEEGQDPSSENESSLTPTASVSTTANATVIEGVKCVAFYKVWSADLAN